MRQWSSDPERFRFQFLRRAADAVIQEKPHRKGITPADFAAHVYTLGPLRRDTQ